jgi:hypothetical protein
MLLDSNKIQQQAGNKAADYHWLPTADRPLSHDTTTNKTPAIHCCTSKQSRVEAKAQQWDLAGVIRKLQNHELVQHLTVMSDAVHDMAYNTRSTEGHMIFRTGPAFWSGWAPDINILQELVREAADTLKESCGVRVSLQGIHTQQTGITAVV